MTHQYKTRPIDKQAALSGKVENDFNKLGNEKASQKNEGKRTPASRSDRENNIGVNQTQARRGSVNQGNKR